MSPHKPWKSNSSEEQQQDFQANNFQEFSWKGFWPTFAEEDDYQDSYHCLTGLPGWVLSNWAFWKANVASNQLNTEE